MPLFARKPRSLPDALIDLADSLERHVAEIRRLAGQPGPATEPADEPGLDDALIDIEEITRHDEACSRRG